MFQTFLRLRVGSLKSFVKNIEKTRGKTNIYIKPCVFERGGFVPHYEYVLIHLAKLSDGTKLLFEEKVSGHEGEDDRRKFGEENRLIVLSEERRSYFKGTLQQVKIKLAILRYKESWLFKLTKMLR